MLKIQVPPKKMMVKQEETKKDGKINEQIKWAELDSRAGLVGHLLSVHFGRGLLRTPDSSLLLWPDLPLSSDKTRRNTQVNVTYFCISPREHCAKREEKGKKVPSSSGSGDSDTEGNPVLSTFCPNVSPKYGAHIPQGI